MGSRIDFQSSRQSAVANARVAVPSQMAVLRSASLALTVLIFLLIALGGLVRNAGAGLACPDWPLCFGHVVPPMNMQVFLEWFHRLIAGGVSLLLLSLTGYIAWRPELRTRLGKFCAAAIGLLLCQIVLGGLTVLGLLDPKWVSSHLAVGQAFFGMVLWLTLSIHDLDRQPLVHNPARGFLVLSVVTTATIYGQMLLGGFVSSNYAGLACPDFPTCNGALVPPLVGLVRIQFLHRAGSVLATLAIVALCYAAVTRSVSARGRRALRALPALLALQICLGIGSVLFQLPLLMSVAHLATAAALFGMLLVTTYEVRYY